MYIHSIQIENYKSLLSSPEIQFARGFNVIVGRNNVGKTALVEALSVRLENKPHRSTKTIPAQHAIHDQISKAYIVLEVGKDELIDLPFNPNTNSYVPASPFKSVSSENFWFAVPDKLLIKFGIQNNLIERPYFQLNPGEEHFKALSLKFDQPNRSFLLRATDFQETHHTVGIASFIAEILKQRIYLFNAERLNISQHRISPGLEVQPNAANLAQVLHYLHTSNPSQFDRLTQLLGTILPEIKSITIPPIDGSSARILVWSIGPDSERADLAIPLSESGTGIGQVLAILFVAVTSAFSRTIIIDEPQSFLHPGAIRKLFDILKHKFSQHQYIITTHSPVAITAVEPQMILLVRKEDEESRIESIDVMETQGARLALSEIGARLSDVFGAENILWVEGRTEELCFPLILSRIAKQGLLGTAIIGIVQIGDFEGKLSKTIFEIYVRLSKGRGLLPPAIGFIFDQEGRSERERDDLVRQSGGKIVFLPRRMYENYVLNPIAIAAIMSSLEGFRGTRVESDEIKD